MDMINDTNEIPPFGRGKVLSLLLAILLLNGCMAKTTSGVRLEPGQLQQIKIGKTT